MEDIVKRILAILQAELPGLLTRINVTKSASDVSEFGVALTLAAPTEYRYGPYLNIGPDLPILQVYEVGGTHEGFSDSDPGIEALQYEVWLFFSGDFSLTLNVMMSRYMRALKAILRKYFTLKNPSKSDALAMGGMISGFDFPRVHINDMVYNAIKIEVGYKVQAMLLDQKYGIY